MIHLKLKDGEADVLMGAVVDAPIRYARELLRSGQIPTADDYDTLWKQQSVLKKLQRALGMPDETLFQLLAAAYGKPDPLVHELLIEAQRRCGGRSDSSEHDPSPIA